MFVFFTLEGFIGADCSVSEDEPPQLKSIENDGTCDVREKTCNLVHLTVRDIVDSDQLTCRLTHIEVNPFK